MTVMPLRHPDGCVTHFAGHHRDAGERLRIDSKVAKDTLSGAHQPTAIAVRDDRLTGLYTLPYLEELLKRDWAVAHREQRSIAMFAVDIDALDLYNTTFGRAAGDSTIRRVAHVVSACLRRSSDVTARIDGGSLIAFAPGLSIEQAMRVGQLMAERVRDLRIHHPRSAVLRYISISVGRLRRRARRRRQSFRSPAESATAAAVRQEIRAKPGGLEQGREKESRHEGSSALTLFRLP